MYLIAILVIIIIFCLSIYVILVVCENNRLKRERLKRMKEMDENATIQSEQEKINLQADEKTHEIEKHEKQRLENDRQNEEKRLSEESHKDYERNQKEIQKDSDRRRETDRSQREAREIAKQQDDLRKAQEEIKRIQDEQSHEQQGKYLDQSKSKEQIPQSQELRDLANTQTGFERQIRAQSQVNAEYTRMIEKHDSFKDKVDTLEKINKGMEQTKDKGLMKKYQANKENLERDIERDYGISKEKPKLFQSKDKKNEIEKEYKGKLQEKVQEFAKGKDYAVESLSENKNVMGKDNGRHDQIIREKVQEKVQERIKTQANTQSQGRGR